VRLVENGKNLGFGGGTNVGILAARGKYLMILNNDTRIDPGCVGALKESIEKDNNYGACASKILLQEEGDRIDAAGIAICPDGLSIGRGRLEKSDLYDQEMEVFFASGCLSLPP
jgi:GT2 family glycosyltransferase